MVGDLVDGDDDLLTNPGGLARDGLEADLTHAGLLEGYSNGNEVGGVTQQGGLDVPDDRLVSGDQADGMPVDGPVGDGTVAQGRVKPSTGAFFHGRIIEADGLR